MKKGDEVILITNAYNDYGFQNGDRCVVDDPGPLGLWVIEKDGIYVSVSKMDITKIEKTEGVKNDNGKPDLAQIPTEALESIARAFMDGEKKYGRYNFKKGMDWSKLISAVLRHMRAFNKGEDYASDSKLHHLGHAGAGICILLDYYHNNLGTDNRFKPNPTTDDAATTAFTNLQKNKLAHND